MIKKITLIITLIITLLLFIVLPTKAVDNTIGIGIFYGKDIAGTYPVWHSSSDHEWECFIVHPTYSWLLSDKWEIYLEGDIGHYSFKKVNVYSLSISLMADYKILGPIYIEAGCGTGYWTGTPNEVLVKDDLIGLIKYGTGAKIQLDKKHTIKIGYRFTHSSEVFVDDTGANTHGILFSISKLF